MQTSGVHELPLWAVAVFVSIILLLAVEVGFRIEARSRIVEEGSESRDISLGSMLALLGLLLAFTYAFTLSRADNRKIAIVNEANAIGTAFLRADMAEEPARTQLRHRLLEYARTRMALPKRAKEARELLRSSLTAQEKLWPATKFALRGDLSDPMKVSIMHAMNAVLDSHTARAAVAFDFLPPVVLVLLMLIAAACLTFAAQRAAKTNKIVRWRLRVFAIILAGLMLTIIDFDRPYEGFIQWNNQSIAAVVQEMEAALID